MHRKSKLKHCQYACAVSILIFRPGFFWSVLSPYVTNAMTFKLWVRIGHLNMFPLRSTPWVDDVMWHGNYVTAFSGCHHESTILDFLIFPWQRTKIDSNFIKINKRMRMLNYLKVESFFKKTNFGLKNKIIQILKNMPIKIWKRQSWLTRGSNVKIFPVKFWERSANVMAIVLYFYGCDRALSWSPLLLSLVASR